MKKPKINRIPEYQHQTSKDVLTCHCGSNPAQPGMANASVAASWKNKTTSNGAT
jgi:hypothetical protein